MGYQSSFSVFIVALLFLGVMYYWLGIAGVGIAALALVLLR